MDVDPPRMWATYDTTGRVGQRVAFQPRLYRLDENTRQWTLIDYTGRYRVVIDMYWYANAYSAARRLTKWMPVRGEFSGDAPPTLDCNIPE